MTEAWDILGILRQNLIDAGCGQETVAKGLACAKSGSWPQLAALLGEQKRFLLAQLHTRQKQIDCLDYLVYQINKNQEG